MLPPFATLARQPHVDLEVLAFSVADGLWDGVDVPGAQRGLDRMAEHLLDLAGGEALLVPGLLPRLPCASLGSGPAALRLDRAVAGCPAHPLVLSVVAVGITRRAGVPLAILTDGRRHLVAQRDTRRAFALDPTQGFRPAAVRAGSQLRWRCPHEVAHLLLGHLAEESVRCGDIARAVGALELRAEMVTSDEDREIALAQRDGMRARLN